MSQLRIALADDMTPGAEGTRLILSPGSSGYFRNGVLRNVIANLAQDVELGTCWFGLFFHPCLVAGLQSRANTFFAQICGMAVI